MEHDHDDPPPTDNLLEPWHFLNRWAEEWARYLRSLGIEYADFFKKRS